MATAFDPIDLPALTLPNRIAMAPLTRRRAYGPGLSATELMGDYYIQRCSTGLIISEALQPNRVGQGYTWTPGIHDERQVASWRPITERVHNAGGRIFAQLMHAGRNSHPVLLGGGLHPVAPSPVAAEGQVRISTDGPAVRAPYPVPHELTVSGIRETISDFADAAARCDAAGFDGVELHGAYGYLIQQFLSDTANQRTDRYGGSIANRIRFVLELVDSVAARIGPGRLALRISPGCPAFGIRESDVDALYAALVTELRTDLAYLHVLEFPGHRALIRSLRERWPGVFMLNPYQATYADPGAQLRLIEDGLADVLAFGTLFVSNPDLVERLRAGGPFTPADPRTFYLGDHRGYVDYPTLAPDRR
ncbi:alkene reductase [Amycolatopsis sp. WGS_07]|uniref:alkene reductase n=1 Tax=Amycolatopsis sp. WGS_07 TaxID=3076764 RepID=UPI003873103A